MIRRTFQLIHGVGPSREKDLWSRGITRWDQFPTAGGEVGLSAKQDEKARALLDDARVALERRNLLRLGTLFPPREHWRLYPEFAREAMFFDIETDGREVQRPTVVSLFHEGGFEVFIQGRNLDELPLAMSRHRLWVSFNGSVYDVPILKAYFDVFPEPELHVDLRFLCKRLGLNGGLKKLEEDLGFARPRHLRGVNGMDAVLLWRYFKRTADLEGLRFLAEYNLYDSIQLKTLFDHAYNLAVEKLGLDEPRRKVFERGDVLYDVSRYLLDLAPSGDELELLERIRSQDRDVNDP